MDDTQPLAPTDAEIVALADATRTAEGGANGYILPISFARAVLAKWGTLRADRIVIPTNTMEQEFQKHYQRGYAAGQRASATQPTQAQAGAVPLTDEQIRAMCKQSWVFDTAKQWVRITERAHGIKGGQHGTDT